MTTLKTGTVIDESTWNSPNYTPAAAVPAVFGRPRTTGRITIHHWGADGQNFNAVANYLSRAGGNSSAHFVVEAGRVACLVSPVNASWHSGSAEGNATSTGIECRPEMSEDDINEVVALIEWIEDVYGPQEIWLHREWSATACPGRYANMRDEIVRRVNILQGTSGETAAPPVAVVDRVAAIRSELAEIRGSVESIEGQL